jgi:hypothetical protein
MHEDKLHYKCVVGEPCEKCAEFLKMHDIVYWNATGSEILIHETIDEAIEAFVDDLDDIEIEFFGVMTVDGYQRMDHIGVVSPEEVLDRTIDLLDETYGNPDGATELTDAMRDAARKFIDVIEKEYKPWACEQVCKVDVNVCEWRKDHHGKHNIEKEGPN